MKYSEITEKIIGAAMTVHSQLKRGYPEKYYQRAMAIELRLNNLNYERECSTPVWYREYIIGDRRVDFLIENKISLELKAASSIDPGDFVQALNYIEHNNLEVGLLINFGTKSLQFHRLRNKEMDDTAPLDNSDDNL